MIRISATLSTKLNDVYRHLDSAFPTVGESSEVAVTDPYVDADRRIPWLVKRGRRRVLPDVGRHTSIALLASRSPTLPDEQIFLTGNSGGGVLGFQKRLRRTEDDP